MDDGIAKFTEYCRWWCEGINRLVLNVCLNGRVVTGEVRRSFGVVKALSLTV